MPSSTSSSKRLGRWLAELLAFLAVLAVPLLACEARVRALDNSFEARRAADLAAGRALLVLGPSTAARAIDPRPLGPGAYNAALYGAGLPYWQVWWELVGRTSPRPARVLLELPWFWDRGGLGRLVENDAAYVPVRAWAALMLRPGTDRVMALANSSVLNQRRSELLPLMLGRLTDLAPNAHAGWVPRELSRVRPADHPSWQQAPPHASYPVNPDALATIEAFLDALAADGVDVVLVQTPSYLPEMPDVAARNAPLHAMALRRGLAFLDYNGERSGPLNMDRSAFWDPLHMAMAAAPRFSARLAADLRALERR